MGLTDETPKKQTLLTRARLTAEIIICYKKSMEGRRFGRQGKKCIGDVTIVKPGIEKPVII